MTIFQRIPQRVSHIHRLQTHNTNGIQNNHNNVHSHDANFRFSNLINNNASSINNNINQQSSNHIVVDPHMQQSQSSDSAMFRNAAAVQRYKTTNNDSVQRRSENYQTTSEGSTSPESSSESSTEEWESGKFWTYFLRFSLGFYSHILACISIALACFSLPPFTQLFLSSQ